MDASGSLLFQAHAGVDGLLVRVRAGTETLQTPVLWDHVALWVWESEAYWSVAGSSTGQA